MNFCGRVKITPTHPFPRLVIRYAIRRVIYVHAKISAEIHDARSQICIRPYILQTVYRKGYQMVARGRILSNPLTRNLFLNHYFYDELNEIVISFNLILPLLSLYFDAVPSPNTSRILNVTVQNY